MRCKLLILFISVGFPFLLQGQTHILLQGEVIDSGDKTGIPFAQVKINQTSIGVITNFAGEFRLHIPQAFSQDTLQFSSIGYVTSQIPIQQLIQKDFLSISLGKRIYTLDEVAIRDKKRKNLDADEIVRKALTHIKQNYPREEQILSGYYRDYLWKDSSYLNLLEAAVKVYDPGFAKYDYKHTELALEQFRFSNAHKIDTSFSDTYSSGNKIIPDMQMNYAGGNEFAVLRLHDPIRNYRHPSFAFVFVLRNHFREFHTFQLDSVLLQEEDILYEISFSLKPNSTFKHLVKGKIFIRATDFAIFKFSYQNLFRPEDSEEGIRYEILVEYQEFEGRMALKYISMNNYLLVRKNAPVFQVKKTELSPDGKRLFVSFNQPLEFRSSENPDNYKLYVKGKASSILKVSHLDIDKVALYLQKSFSHNSYKDFTLEVTQVSSVYGDVINTVLMEPMYQYREFFVNKIELPGTEPVDVHTFMDKEQSIYDHSIEEKTAFWESYNFVLSQPLKKN